MLTYGKGTEGAIGYFNRWLKVPFVISGVRTVLNVMNALNAHPISKDECAQDYFMPESRYLEKAGKFRIYRENQETWHCFVLDGDQDKIDAPVYFETCLDLEVDCGVAPNDIIDGDRTLACDSFQGFLWHMLGAHLCLRAEGSSEFSDGVNGVTFSEDIEVGDNFSRPLGRPFPGGYAPCFAENTICVPEWGAAFLDDKSREEFIKEYSPKISGEWR